MPPLTVKIHLKGLCIETGVKKKLKELTYSYLESYDEKSPLLKEIELLQEFIKQADFPGLRTSDDRLAGIKESFVIISKDSLNNVNLEIEEKNDDS
jgi:hypothetical protein